MAGFENDVMVAKNINFNGAAAKPHLGIINASGKIPIGTGNVSPTPEILGGTLTSPDNSVTIGYVSPNITLQVTGSASFATSLTPDVGAVVTAVAGTIPTLGFDAGTVQTMRTYNDGAGNFRIADQTWETQYVVDASTTNGLRGTFTTVQAAINQALADGMAFNNPKKIYIRTGTYTEDLTIQPGTILVGEVMSYPVGGAITPQVTTINGTHTFTGNAVVGFNNLSFLNVSVASDTFSGGDIVLAYFDNCYLASTSTENFINIIAASSLVKFSRCSFVSNGDQTCFTMTDSSSTISFYICEFSQPAAFECAGTLNFLDTTNIGEIKMTAATLVNGKNSSWLTNSATFFFSGTGLGGTLRNCSFVGALTAALQSTSGTWYLQACAAGDGTSNQNRLYQNGTLVTLDYQTQGNLIRSRTVSITSNLTANDYYVGVTSTAAPRTINLPDGTGEIANQDQVFIIKDQSGGAFTNNITVTTQGGTVTIDGQTSKLINSDYGSMTVKFDGTNYFII